MDEPRYHLGSVVHAKGETLEDFDGPLDVIFLLLSKNKIEIQDVSITSILEQYLAYLDEMKRLDMEIASEFIAMASHLMLIKTKMLLSAAEREEAMSEMELLIRSPRQVFSAERIMERVWGWDNEAEINVVWVNISNLRKKLRAIGSRVTLRANRGLGYVLEEET